mmetsp:Transcript_2749/g.3657  ORF Transcript_2749/g.3657 Transcript_2749/m.3657 type:complete len:103 (-) Transcript_2749:1321-1629(-)
MLPYELLTSYKSFKYIGEYLNNILKIPQRYIQDNAKHPPSVAISSNSFSMAGAAGTSSFISGRILCKRLTPFETWYSEIIAFLTRNEKSAAIASKEEVDVLA